MDTPYWYYVADSIQNLVTTIAILIGGAWAIYRFWLKREKETAINLNVNYLTEPYGDLHIVFVEVTIANCGSVSVRAKKESPAYKDDVEIVSSSGHLRLRPIKCNSATQEQILWFPNGAKLAPLEDDIEADLLTEYAVDGRPRFWMEPGETYRIGATLLLPPGQYMGMATFIGDRGKEEFWRQVFLLIVPRRDNATS